MAYNTNVNLGKVDDAQHMMGDDGSTQGFDVLQALHRGCYPDWVKETTMAEIIDPATKMRLEVPLTMMSHTNGLRLYFDNKHKPRRRESYLCMLYQKKRCKSHMKCNQIHADRVFVSSRRNKFEASEVEPHTDQRLLEVIVADPSNSNSKVVIPYTKTTDSEGRRRYLELQKQPLDMQTNAPHFRICPGLIQNGMCLNSDPTFCEDIHAQLDFLQFLKRPRACCAFHGDNVMPFSFPRGRIFMVNRHGQRYVRSG